jgi:hypothetical protein
MELARHDNGAEAGMLEKLMGQTKPTRSTSASMHRSAASLVNHWTNSDSDGAATGVIFTGPVSDGAFQ